MDHPHGATGARAEHATLIADLARVAADRVGDRPVTVAIDGRSGSGKSSLAQLVSNGLGNCPVVHMDDLYAGWDGLAASVATLVTDVLQPLHAGRSGRYRRYDWHLEQFTEQVTVPARQFLVVEGCGSSVGAAGVLSDVRVWLDAPAQARRERALARADDGFAEHWDTWAAAEDDLFEADDTAAHAQLRLETGC